LTEEDGAALAKDIAAAQRAGKGFSRSISVTGSARTMLIRGAPAGPQLGSPGSVILWMFDATESQSQIAALEDERQQLRDALDALSGLIEAAPMPMWYRGPDLRLGLVNSAYVKAVEGSDAATVIAEGVELIETADGVTPMAAAAQAMEGKTPLARIVPATIGGERRAMRVVDVPIGPAGVAGFAIDMHELEEARVEHKRFAEAQRDMLDRLSAGVAQFGSDRALIFANQPFLSLFSLEPDQVGAGPDGAPEFDRVLDRMREAGRLPEHRDFPAWRAEHRGWFQSADAHEENWLLADGTHLRVFGQPLPDGGLLLIFEDRTEQLQLSSARDTLLRVRTATFDNLFEAVGVFASDGRLSLWNSRFKRLWGIEEELLTKHPRVDELMAAVAQTLAKPQQASIVQELVRTATIERKQKSGHVGFADGRWFEFAAIPLPDGNALFVMLDVTDSRRIEQALRDKNEALEEGDKVKTAFLSNMSYELRTPLTSIAGFAEMLAAGYAGKLTESGQGYAEAIVESTGRLAGLIDNVLDLTQGEAGALPLDRAPADLAKLAADAAAQFDAMATSQGVEIALTIDPALGIASVDRRRIVQALNHLLDNAVRHVGKGGRVLLHGDGTQAKARLVVSDNGPGMDARGQALAFDRFSRAEQAGRGAALGLGLPLARQLVEAHGGTLTLISEPGQGTVVTIELPRG
jgi:signal transduction histidine kinase